MLGWIKRRAEAAIVDAATQDIERFIKGLRGASDEEVSFIVAMATLLRLNFESMGRLPRYVLDLRLPRDQYQADMAQLYLNKAVNEFQKIGQPSDATAAMVWLHSARSLNIPEVRYLGREMWGELCRGMADAPHAASEVCGMVGKNVPTDIETEVRFIPGGLEPSK